MTKDMTDRDGAMGFLSPFWTRMFPDRGFPLGMSEFHAAATRQIWQEASEFVNSASAATAPLVSRELIVPFRIRRSEMSVGPMPLTYGRGFVYGDQPGGTEFREGDVFEYGGAERLAPFFYWGIPEGIGSIGSTIHGRPDFGAPTLLEGQDWIQVSGAVVFPSDPFLNPALAHLVSELPDGDREMVLWINDAWRDDHLLRDRFGFPFTEAAESTAELREFILACQAVVSGGPSIRHLDRFVAAAGGLPCAPSDGVVSDVEPEFVATRDWLAPMPSGASPRPGIVPGAHVRAGEPLSGATRVDDLVSDPKWWRSIPGLTLGPAWFGNGFPGPLHFRNADSVVTSGPGGSCRFEILGSPEALEEFWRRVDAEDRLGTDIWAWKGLGPMEGNTVANPLEILVEGILGVSAILVRIAAQEVPDYRSLMARLPLLDPILPSGTKAVFVVDHSATDGYAPGGGETLSGAVGLVVSDPPSIRSWEEIRPRATLTTK